MQPAPHRIKQFAVTYDSQDASIQHPLPMPDELLKIYWDAIGQAYVASDGSGVWRLETREAVDRPISPGVFGRYIRATAPYDAGIDQQTGWRREDPVLSMVAFRGIRPFVLLEILAWDESPGRQAHKLHANLVFTDNLSFYDPVSEALTAQALLLSEQSAAMVLGLPDPATDYGARRVAVIQGQWNHPDYAYESM